MNNSDNDCSAQRRIFEQASGRAGDFQNGVGSGFTDFFRGIGNLVTDPVGTANAMWNSFTDDPLSFAFDMFIATSMHPLSFAYSAATGFQEDGWYGLGRFAGEHLARCTLIATTYIACQAIGYGISAASAKKTGTVANTPVNNLDDLLANPQLLGQLTPDQWFAYLRKAGSNPQPLGRGSTQGLPFEQGGGFRVNWGGDRILQYHPGSVHHGGVPYYKLSSGITGTNRYDILGNILP